MPNFYRLFNSNGNFFEREAKRHLNIRTTFRRIWISLLATAKELIEYASAAHPAKNIGEMRENIVRILVMPEIIRANTFVAETVVPGALIAIAQYLVSFGRFLEFFFGFFIIRISVRMKLHSELAIRFLYLIDRRRPNDFENLIIITLHYLTLHSCCIHSLDDRSFHSFRNKYFRMSQNIIVNHIATLNLTSGE